MKARSIGLSLSLALSAIAGGATAARAGGPDDSIVRVTSVLRVPNPVRPWTKLNLSSERLRIVGLLPSVVGQLPDTRPHDPVLVRLNRGQSAFTRLCLLFISSRTQGRL